jgi:peptidyl-prolyl cis-trans isomerase C
MLDWYLKPTGRTQKSNMNVRCLFACSLFAAVLSAQIPQVGAAPAPTQQTLTPETVVATVGGDSVTVDDVRKMLDKAPAQLLQFFKQRPQDFIQQYFLFRYLTSEGDKLKLGEQSPLKEQLEAQRGWVIANAMVNHEQDAYNPTEQQITDFYNKNQARWQEAKIKAILVGFKAAATAADPKDLEAGAKRAFEAAHPANERSEEDAKKLAAEIVKQLRSGADFAKLVEQYSDDVTSKQSGGEFPAISPTSPYPEDLKKAIFSLNKGQVTDPVRQPTGFYIIRMEDRVLQPLNDARNTIITELRASHRNEWLTDLNRRYAPAIQKPEFFLNPEFYVQQAMPGAAPKK